MTRLLIIFLFYGCVSVCVHEFVEAASDVPEYCGKGQVAWCQNFTTSIECQTTKYCQETVWLSDKPSHGSCGNCETEIQKIRQSFESFDVSEWTEGLCNSTFNSHFLRLECQNSLNQYARYHSQEWLNFLKSNVHPATVCLVAGLCSGIKSNSSNSIVSSKNSLHFPATNPGSDPALCFVCQYLLHFVQEELEKPEEQQRIEEAMNRTCKLAPKSLRTECQSFVFEYGALMISLFSQKIDPSLVCPAMKICPQNISEEGCHQCLTLMENMAVTSSNSYAEQQRLEVLSSLMRASNIIVGAEELKFNHEQDLIDLTSSQFKPAEKCELLRFCDPKTLSSKKIT